MKSYFIFFTLVVFGLKALAQPSWKLVKAKGGINVYMASVENSKFKSIRVQTVIDGTVSKLISILCNISNHPDWVYNTKSAYILKQISPYEFVYYTETILPWPISNRDAIIHLTMMPDTVRHLLRVTAFSEPDFIEKKKGLVRIPFHKGNWYVTESANQINIEYTFEVDPGGSLPAWLVNMLADEGPYESFQNLRMKLRY